MGTTVNGTYIGGKQGRRQRVLDKLRTNIKRLEEEIRKKEILKKYSNNPESTKLLKYYERINNEKTVLEDRLSGKKKVVVIKDEKTGAVVPKQRWFIDIYSVHMSYVKNSERRKNKGKSKKKLKKVKSTSLIRSIIFQEGMIDSFRQGRMGISPKTHTFRIRREEPQTV